MANFEQNSPDPSPGDEADVPSEVIEAFKNVHIDLDQSYVEAKQKHAAIVSWLQIEAERRRLSSEQKRGFMMGALSMLGLYDFEFIYEREIRPLEQLFTQDAYTDENHTEPPK